MAKPHPMTESGKGTEEWYTPPYVIEIARRVLGQIDLDPASCLEAQTVVCANQYFNLADDGLAQPWPGRIFVNPPYSRAKMKQFVGKLVHEYQHNANFVSAVMLCGNRTETEWCQTLINSADAMCFIASRVRFWGPGGQYANTPRHGHVLFYFGPWPRHFQMIAEKIGTVLWPVF